RNKMTKNPASFLNQDVLKGGEFIIKESTIKDTFIPEEINEEQRMIQKMCLDFIKTELLPNMEKMEKQEGDIVPNMLEKAAELGLLGTHMPQEYGGMELDTNTNTFICDAMGPSGSFSTTFAAHTG